MDPLAGSFYVESLTSRIEAAARDVIARVDVLGGAERAIAAGMIQEEIARSAYEHQRAVESGNRVIVGVNEYVDDQMAASPPTPDFTALGRDQAARVAAARASRDAAGVASALNALREVAPAYTAARGAGRPPLMAPIIAAVKARCTVGEISDVFRAAWGEYRPG